jgi:hypothetical protein
MPLDPSEAYSNTVTSTEPWIAVGETSRYYPSIHFIRWEDIVKDIDMKNPEYLDVRKLHLGVQMKQDTKFVTG